MKSLVTGGAGFIGTHLVDKLRKDQEIVILDDLSCSRKPTDKKNVKFVHGSIFDGELMMNLIDQYGITHIYHLAGMTSVFESTQKPEYYHLVNVEGTKKVLEVAELMKVDRVLLTSSASVYGEKDHPVSEDEETNPASPYAKSKLDAEQICCEYDDVISLRLFNVYGKGNNKGIIHKFDDIIRRYNISVPETYGVSVYGDGQQQRDYIHISDVVKAMVLACESKYEGSFNVGTGKVTSVIELFNIIREYYNNPTEVSFLPEREGDIKYSCANINKIKKRLGWNPRISLEEGIKKL